MYEERWLAVEAYEYVGEAGMGGSCDGDGDGGRSVGNDCEVIVDDVVVSSFGGGVVSGGFFVYSTLEIPATIVLLAGGV